MIDRESLTSRCAGKPGVIAEFPFGPEVLVYKVLGKMFALIPEDGPLQISLKCDPMLAVMLRDTYTAVTPGYHLNKRHWNTVAIDGEVPDDEILEMVDNSYALVVKSLPKAERKKLENA